MMARRRPGLFYVASLVVFLGSPPALADDVGAARERFEEGKSAFRAGRYAEAAEAYERSAAAHPHPAPLVNAAEAWELDGNLVRAAQACDRALTLRVDAKLRGAIEHRLARLSRGIATISLRGAADVGVRVDGGEIMHPPVRLRVSPGRHVLTYIGEGSRPATEEELSVTAGEQRTIVVSARAMKPQAPERPLPPSELSEPPAPTPSAPPTTTPASATVETPRASSGGPPLGTWISFAAAGAAGVTAGVLGGLTVAAKDAYEQAPAQDTLDTFRDRRLVTNVAIGVAAAAAAIGVILWLVHPGPRDASMVRSSLLIRWAGGSF